MTKHGRQPGFSIIGIILTLAIIGLLYYVLSKAYLKNPSGVTRETQKVLAEQGIDTSNLPGTVQKAKEAAKKADEINKKISQNLEQVK